MKYLSFSRDGQQSYGMFVEGRIVDLGACLGADCPTLRSAIASGRLVAASNDVSADAGIDLASVTMLPPIPEPSKILCVGRNYHDHVSETGNDLPDNPLFFVRLTNTLVASGAAMILPRISDQFDFEGELAIVIGKPGRHIARENAMDHVFGYSCFNDGSVRDFQFNHSLTAGKNFAATGGFGPWIVTSDEFPDPRALTLMTRLNGVEVQRSSVDQLIFDVPYLISYLSGITNFEAGDVIVTGTPAGVGLARAPQLWMKPGDRIEVEIDGIGVLANTIEAET